MGNPVQSNTNRPSPDRPFIETIPEGEATGIVKRQYDAAVQRAGYVANIIKLMSLEPELLQASIRFYLQLMHAPAPLSRRHREMLAVVVSNVNGCYY